MRFFLAVCLAAALAGPSAGLAASSSLTMGVGLTIVASCPASGCRSAARYVPRSRASAPFYTTVRPAEHGLPARQTTTY
jgi:hypothetical protein